MGEFAGESINENPQGLERHRAREQWKLELARQKEVLTLELEGRNLQFEKDLNERRYEKFRCRIRPTLDLLGTHYRRPEEEVPDHATVPRPKGIRGASLLLVPAQR